MKRSIRVSASMMEVIHSIESLRGIFAATSDISFVRDSLSVLEKHWNQPVLDLSPNSTWRRGVRATNGRLIERVADLSYPPPKHTSRGRANLASNPVLYASRNVATAVAELAIEQDETFFVLDFALKPGATCKVVVIGEYEFLRNTPDRSLYGFSENTCHKLASAAHQANSWSLIDCFLAEMFRRRPVGHGTSDYVVTSEIAALLTRNTEISGLVYPSVALIGGVNLALKPSAFDSMFRVDGARKLQLTSDVGYGITGWTNIAHSKNIDGTGLIDWSADAPEMKPNVFRVGPTPPFAFLRP